MSFAGKGPPIPRHDHIIVILFYTGKDPSIIYSQIYDAVRDTLSSAVPLFEQQKSYFE